MPDHHEAVRPASSTDPFMGVVIITLVVLLVVVIWRAAGLNWKGLLHWTGELLLLLGIGLAAKGISDVRREWTSRPGMWRSIMQVRRRAVSVLWLWWDQAVMGFGRLAKWLHLRVHQTAVASSDVLVSAEAAEATAAALPGRVVVTGGTVEERLDRLESRMRDAEEQFSSLDAWRHQEVRDRQAATKAEQDARMAEDQRIRQRMADLVGGGLRLQAWGVACLLAGTIITAIW
jgi:hypothetical protein